MDIADVHSRLVPEIHERLSLLRSAPPIATVSRELEELSSLFEGLALCHLLESLDLGQMRENLCRSGHARRFFLTRSKRQGNTGDRRLALGRTSALLDVLAAGDLPLARDIAQLSTLRWDPRWEYEDDFCFFLFLHVLLRTTDGGAPMPDPAAILNRFASALEGADSPRLSLCRALLAGDEEAFAESLEERLDEIEGEQDRERLSSAVQEDFDVAFWPRSFVSIEGLALLQLAGMRGMKVPGDLPRCPTIARLPVGAPPYDDLLEMIAGLP